MKQPISLLLALLAILSFSGFAAPLHAEPATTESGTDSGSESSGEKSGLNKELAPPAKIEGAQIRSYVRKEDGAKITEYSVKGSVYMIRVQPVGNFPAYYLYDSNGDGVFNQRLPGGYKHISPPMWVIKKF